MTFLMILVLIAGTTASISEAQEEDVLFVVLGKMSLYSQARDGELTLRNHHFVAEIMPKVGGKVLGGELWRRDDPSDRYRFESEGEAFLAHGGRFDAPDELHEAHPDGEYVFTYETATGQVDAQVLSLARRPNIESALEAARITLTQASRPASAGAIRPDQDLEVRWTLAPEMAAQPGGLVDDLIFVLAFNCFGERIAHSGRPFQGGSFLTYRDDTFVIPAEALSSGLRYSLIVEQATADTSEHEGIPGIATYATLTFVDFETAGDATRTCPQPTR